ncbi:hypothetical protein Nit79A3_2754 [Nitrosomonas sp. Is79A3]|uniref:hypothetical protein n=1 Tax=Nitrosomonas sp. (strain Is79A3) TaxID=261292 RepID=UPI000215D210
MTVSLSEPRCAEIASILRKTGANHGFPRHKSQKWSTPITLLLRFSPNAKRLGDGVRIVVDKPRSQRTTGSEIHGVRAHRPSRDVQMERSCLTARIEGRRASWPSDHRRQGRHTRGWERGAVYLTYD